MALATLCLRLAAPERGYIWVTVRHSKGRRPRVPSRIQKGIPGPWSGGVYGTRTRGLRRDRQRTGCGSEWQLFATVRNAWKSLREKHRLLSRFRRTFQAASYTWVTVDSLGRGHVDEASLGSGDSQSPQSLHLDRLQALRRRKAPARSGLECHPHFGGGASTLRMMRKRIRATRHRTLACQGEDRRSNPVFRTKSLESQALLRIFHGAGLVSWSFGMSTASARRTHLPHPSDHGCAQGGVQSDALCRGALLDLSPDRRREPHRTPHPPTRPGPLPSPAH